MKKLAVGHRAPVFHATDVDGAPVALDSQPRAYVLMAFLRYAGCPWCNLAVHRLALESKMLAQNDCDVVVFVQSTQQKIHENIRERHAIRPDFPIVADPAKKIYRQYGVNSSLHAVVRAINDIPAWVHAVREHGLTQGKLDGNLFLAQALFLVSCKTNQIVQVLYGKSLYEHETFTPIYQSLIFKET
jgi:peroxiredoxin Q/BCP